MIGLSRVESWVNCMPPLVSILIPAYNAAPWIDQAIQSALAQTWPRKETIVVDDGSKDATLAVARRFESSQVSVATHTNRGASATRNEALARCQGEYIQWLDADDLLLPDKVALQMAAARSAGPEVLISSEWARFYYRPARARFVPDPLWRDLSPVEWLQTKMETNSYMAIQSWLVSRHLTEKAGPWDTALSADDDGDYFARVVCASRRVQFVTGARSLCRAANPRSLSRAKPSRRWMDSQFVAVCRQIECLRRLDDGARTRQACRKLLADTLNYFHPDQPELVAETQRLAAGLGGEIALPDVRRKYRWIRRAFGWEAARTAQAALPATRAWCDRTLDRCLSACGL
jgi:glycosyltransferase involved in cell wall biosynthesis